MIKVSVKKDGDSKSIIIPCDIAKYLGLEIGTKLNLELDKDVMIFRKVE
jgi:antitoxin component of MazEF toxin-antitoxin module